MASTLAALRIEVAATDDEDEEDEAESEYECPSCAGNIDADEEVILLQVVTPFMHEGKAAFMVEFDDEGEPIAPPLLLHDDCWNDVGEALVELARDEPPVQEPESFLSCDGCNCTIRMGETMALGDKGVVEENPRLGGLRFIEKEGEPETVLCLVCAMRVADITEVVEWTGLTQDGECYHCTKSKCWRKGRCTCSCHRNQEG